MSPFVALLLLWGFTLGPETDGATFFLTKPSLWAEPESLLEPWANLTLTCESVLQTQEFQLLKNGVVQESAHLDRNAMKHRFPIGAVTSDNQGLYCCRILWDSSRWTELSNVVEVTGRDPLPQPQLSANPVPWITPGLDTKLLCQVGFHGVTFLLRREGDDGFLEVVQAAKDGQAAFPVHQPGNYSCSYRTHVTGKPSEPSAKVTIKEYATPPPPELSYLRTSQVVLVSRDEITLSCVAPVSTAQFQLRQGKEELKVPRASTSPENAFFDLKLKDIRDNSPLTCRYRLSKEDETWSEDSKPFELLWSDETLPAPVLRADPEGQNPAPGSLVKLLCKGPKAGLRFILQRRYVYDNNLVQVLQPTGDEAVFKLPDISAEHSGNYSCSYMDVGQPFAGSPPSANLELRVDGLAPRPKLRALWTGTVAAGDDAVLHCEAPVSDVFFHLLRDGEKTPFITQRRWSSSTYLLLPFVGPQHTGNYSCRYASYQLDGFQSELSEPVELLVGGR